MARIGFIGTGIMGGAMAGRLLRAGHEVCVHTRSPGKARALLDDGAVWCATPGEVAACPIVFTMLGLPSDVEQVYLGAEGLLARAEPGAILVDFTTSSPDLAVRLAQAGAARGVTVLDAPVTGGDVGAREGTLAILVGGDMQVLEVVRPLLDCLGRRVVHFGPPGSGQQAKLVNQIAIAGTVQGVAEAVAYAQAQGLDTARVLEAISGGAAGSWQLNQLGPRMAAGDFAPGFLVRHLLKDIGLALEQARQCGIVLPALALAKDRYERLAERLGDEVGSQALVAEMVAAGGEGACSSD